MPHLRKYPDRVSTEKELRELLPTLRVSFATNIKERDTDLWWNSYPHAPIYLGFLEPHSKGCDIICEQEISMVVWQELMEDLDLPYEIPIWAWYDTAPEEATSLLAQTDNQPN